MPNFLLFPLFAILFIVLAGIVGLVIGRLVTLVILDLFLLLPLPPNFARDEYEAVRDEIVDAYTRLSGGVTALTMFYAGQCYPNWYDLPLWMIVIAMALLMPMILTANLLIALSLAWLRDVNFEIKAFIIRFTRMEWINDRYKWFKQTLPHPAVPGSDTTTVTRKK